MTKYRSFNPGDRLPADFENALAEYLGSAALNFLLRIKPGDNTVLQVPAGTDNDQVALAVDGRWRYVSANVERASPGGVAQTFDVYATASDNVFTLGGGGEDDSTDYTFALAIVAAGGSPSGVALTRKIASAVWDGAKFTAVDVIVGAQAGTARHAATHATNGIDPVTPGAIGAATAAALTAETTRAEAAEATNAAAIADETTRAEAAESANSTAIATETTRAEAAEAAVVPIGGMIAYSGSGDLPGGRFVVADGRLIDKTTYATFFARTGHAYNLGVDPGGNMVRIPEKRGRKSVGAINMGTGAPAIDNGRINVATGSHGGEVANTLAESQMPSHVHGASASATGDVAGAGGGGFRALVSTSSGGNVYAPALLSLGVSVGADGGGGSHNNVDPYEADVYLVRIA